MESKDTVKPPKYFHKKSIRLMRDGDINEAITIVKAGIEHYPEDKKLKKWLEAIRGRLWVDHVIGRTSEITKEDIEEIAEDIVCEVMESKGLKEINADEYEMNMYPLDLHTGGMQIYGIKCMECGQTYYKKEKQEFIQTHTEKTNHTQYMNLGLEYHKRHRGWFG